MRDDYFMYFEDVDWGDRARQRGWQLRYLGEVLASHEMGGSSDHTGSRYMSSNTTYYLARNPLRFAIDTPTVALRVSRVFGTGIVWTLFNLTRIRPSEWPTSGRALIEGLLDGWQGRMGRRDLARPKQTRGSQPPTGSKL
jgi:GT2 family glycosyltransferase